MRHLQSSVLTILLFATLGCMSRGPSVKGQETPSAKLALEFAKAMASGDTARAYAMLSPELQSALSPEKLAAQYREMVGDGSGAPTTIQVMSTMDAWPDKQGSDVEWVYVAIANDAYSEAVTVVVSQAKSGHVIRSIEWGRP
jgi:hypothetical protein